MNVKMVSINPNTMPGDGDLAFVMRASPYGGGVTILEAYAVTGAVGTLNLQLLNYGTGGTVNGGTVAAMASGTASTWAVDTPQELTVDEDSAFLEAGEWLVLKKIEAAAGNDLTADAVVAVVYVDGVIGT